MLLLSALLGLLLGPVALGFTFTVDTTTPSSCGTLNFKWSGGKAPFVLTIIPAFDYPSNISIPGGAWSGSSNTGEYAWNVNYLGGTNFVAMMSDATGHGTGGVSQLMTVANSSSTCTMRTTATDFLFYLNATTVNQCDPVQIYWDKTAIAPVTVIGVIPGGQPFMFQSTGGSTSYVWKANIAAGSQFILAAFDNGPIGTGGSSSLMTVGSSGNSACLDDSSPSSTPVATSTATTTGQGSVGGVIKTVTAIATVAPSGSSNSGIGTGGIVGIVLGALIAFLVVQGLLFWFCCRRQLAALLSHRKEMRGREVKHTNDVDLISQHRASWVGDHHHPNASSVNIGAGIIAGDMEGSSSSPGRRTSSGWLSRDRDYSGQSARGGGGGGGREIGRSSLGDPFEAEVESSISPFWDTTRNNRDSGYTNNLHGGLGSSTTDLLPPMLPHIRTGSLSSMDSSVFGGSPSLGPPPHNGERPTSTHDLPYLTSSPSITTFPRSPISPATPGGSTGRRGPTKAELAAAERRPFIAQGQAQGGLRPSNPDIRDSVGDTPIETPQGGIRIHEDAGRITAPPPPPIHEPEELPPLYREEWEQEDLGRDGERGRGR